MNTLNMPTCKVSAALHVLTQTEYPSLVNEKERWSSHVSGQVKQTGTWKIKNHYSLDGAIGFANTYPLSFVFVL